MGDIILDNFKELSKIHGGRSPICWQIVVFRG